MRRGGGRLERWKKKKKEDSPFLTNEVRLALQEVIQHLDDAHELLVVSLLGAGDVFWVELAEPGGLAKVRALAGHLKVQKLLEVVFLGKGRDVELVVLVVRVDQVLEDGARLPQCDARVGILNRGCSAVWVDTNVGLLLDGIVGHKALGRRPLMLTETVFPVLSGVELCNSVGADSRSHMGRRVPRGP